MIHKVGVTGGIGAGKSIVLHTLKILGYPVFYSDKEAKKIMHENAEVRSEITALFGKEAYTSDDTEPLNRSFLAKRIFEDPHLIQHINTIVHPRVRLAFDEFVKEHPDQLVFNEAAILFETGAYKTFDATLLITADIETRIKRVINRDNITREEVLKRISNQWPDDKKIPLATFVIENNSNAKVIPQLLETLKILDNQRISS